MYSLPSGTLQQCSTHCFVLIVTGCMCVEELLERNMSVQSRCTRLILLRLKKITAFCKLDGTSLGWKCLFESFCSSRIAHSADLFFFLTGLAELVSIGPLTSREAWMFVTSHYFMVESLVRKQFTISVISSLCVVELLWNTNPARALVHIILLDGLDFVSMWKIFLAFNLWFKFCNVTVLALRLAVYN